jgi:uncharacterized protein YegP (UPF0339 family)
VAIETAGHPLTQVVLTFTRKETHMTYYYYKDAKGEWRWRLKASNGRVLADSGEGYKNEQDCLEGIKLVKDSANAPVVEIKAT